MEMTLRPIQVIFKNHNPRAGKQMRSVWADSGQMEENISVMLELV